MKKNVEKEDKEEKLNNSMFIIGDVCEERREWLNRSYVGKVH